MLVDAQLTKTNAERVLQEIKETKKPLSIIYIPMSTPIIFLVWRFLKGIPERCDIANSAVVDRINKVYQEKIDKWKNVLGLKCDLSSCCYRKIDGDFIKFENSKIEVLKNIQGDTDENTMLWIPGRESSLRRWLVQ